MAVAKIQLTLGSLNFLGEGEQEWISTQLDKVLSHSQTHRAMIDEPKAEVNGAKSHDRAKPGAVGTLASFLSAKNVSSNQIEKFLVTAVWLSLKGKQRISTSEVTRALKDNHQNKLGNPSDCLNQNVRKGFCEKDNGEFFVTTEGLTHLGISN